MRQQVPNTRLIVVGPGKLDDESRAALERIGATDVVFTGRVSNEDLPRYYNTADIYCAPSLGGESFGIVLAEAMACGTPILASRINGYIQVMNGNLDMGEKDPTVNPNLNKTPSTESPSRQSDAKMSTQAVDEKISFAGSGIMAPPADEVSLAKGLMIMAEDAQRRREMGQRGREIVEQNFSWEIVGTKILEFYDEKMKLKSRYEKRFRS